MYACIRRLAILKKRASTYTCSISFCQARKALEPIATVLMEGGLDELESFAAAAALAQLGVRKPLDLADVTKEDALEVAAEAKLLRLSANKLVKIIASKSVSSPTAKAEVNQCDLSCLSPNSCDMFCILCAGARCGGALASGLASLTSFVLNTFQFSLLLHSTSEGRRSQGRRR